MKPFTVNMSLLVLCFLSYFYQSIGSVTLLILIFSLSPFLVNLLLVPGGFAWRNHYQTSLKKLHGPISWPFLGSLPQMGSHAHRKLASMAVSLGAKRVMALSLGSTRVIITSHPDIAKQILCGTSFSDRPIKDSARLLMFERAIGFAPSGHYWRKLRRIAANHMFSPRSICSLEGVRQRVASIMIEEVREEMKLRCLVDVRHVLRKGSLNNVLESVFGSTNLGLAEKLGLMVDEGYELIAEFNWADYFPLGFLDFGGVKKRCYKLASEVKSIVSEIIEERRREEKFNMKNDFLSVLLSLPQDDQLSDADMVAVLWEMVFRGTDTVAILLEWIIARMVMHQDVQAKAHEEINACIGHDFRPVQDSDISKLPYLQAIVKEVLRLHPPGPLLSWARLAIHDVQVDKYFIPAGTTAMVNMWAITHDPTVWKDPWAFKPERFIEEEITIMGSDLRLAPFGSGRRACPGKALGLATVHLWLARLLQQFKWLPHQSVDLSEYLKLSLEMKKPLKCFAISHQYF